MDEEKEESKKQLETGRGGSGRKGKSAIGLGGSGGDKKQNHPTKDSPQKYRPQTMVFERTPTSL